jgi:hypothetical protein
MSFTFKICQIVEGTSRVLQFPDLFGFIQFLAGVCYLANCSIQRPTLEEITNSVGARVDHAKEKESTYKVPKLGERKVYRKMPIEGECQSFTMSDGERFYVKLKDDESEAIDIERISKPSK